MTAFLAVYAALVSTGALVWGVASWVLTGSRTRVSILAGVTNGSQYATVPIKKSGLFEIPTVHGPGPSMTVPLIFVQVRNIGRIAVTVEDAGFKSQTGEAFGSIGGPDYGQKIPARVEPGQSVMLGYAWNDVEAFAKTTKQMHHGRSVRISGTVSLGSGNVIASRTCVKL